MLSLIGERGGAASFAGDDIFTVALLLIKAIERDLKHLQIHNIYELQDFIKKTFSGM